MDEEIKNALRTDLTIDLTTIGCRTWKPHRIEIWLLNIDGRFFLTGTPGARDWYANLTANPLCTIHLKQRVRCDVEANATPVADPQVRRLVLGHRDSAWYRDQGDGFATLLAEAPMVELEMLRAHEPR